jgi:glycosyltransferase involved in cell wall biosynthesis
MRVLWLASSYPDPYEPTNGDFVERHAIAVAKFVPVDLIHVVQVGKDIRTDDSSTYSKEGNLRQWVHSFAFRKWHIGWLDKIRYHFKYRIFYHALLVQYQKDYGTPALIHVHVPMKAGMLARVFSRRWQIPYLVTDHSSMYDRVAKDHYFTRSFFFQYYSRKIYRDAAMVTNVSAAMAEKVQDLFHPAAMQVIHNVVDGFLFNFQPASSPEIFTWFHASTMFPLKNVESIVEAFKILNTQRQDWQLVIAGPVNISIVNKVKKAGLSGKIRFLGEIPHKAIASWMQRSSALVLFSKHENFPCVIIESLCSGLPVVSSNVGGISEAVNDTNGLLVESENITELAHAMNKTMENYGQFDRQEIACKAADAYAEERIGKQFIDTYRKILR